NAIRKRVLTTVLTAVFGLVPALTFVPAMLHAGSASAGAVVTDGRNFGFSYYGDILANSKAQVNADFDREKAIGGTWVRLAFNGSTLEMHGKGQYNWGPADNLVAAANAHGFNVDAVVSYAPGWARPVGSNDIAPPKNASDYGDFLAAAAKRYA